MPFRSGFAFALLISSNINKEKEMGVTTIIPDNGEEVYPEWTRVSSWIQFFDLYNKRKKVWIRVSTQFISSREGLVEVDIDASELGFYVLDIETQQGGWLESLMSRCYPDLRKILGCKSQFIENLYLEP